MILKAACRLAACFILLLSVSSLSSIYSQNIIYPDSVVIGSSYKFTLYDDTEIIGKVISVDSASLNVAGDEGIFRLKKDNIFLISKKLRSSKFKTMLSLGAGSSLSAVGGETHYPWLGTFSFQLSGLIPMDETKGVRIEAGLSVYNRELHAQDYYNSREMHLYSLKGEFVLGQLSAEEDIFIYGSAGIGIDYMYEPGFEADYYDYYSSTYRHVINDGTGFVSGVISLGGTIGYRLNRNIGLYADIQYNLLTYGGYFIFYGGMAFIPIRAGITYTIF